MVGVQALQSANSFEVRFVLRSYDTSCQTQSEKEDEPNVFITMFDITLILDCLVVKVIIYE